MSKREPQIILKTYERTFVLELGLKGKFAATGGTKTGSSSKGTGWRSRSRAAAGC